MVVKRGQASKQSMLLTVLVEGPWLALNSAACTASEADLTPAVPPSGALLPVQEDFTIHVTKGAPEDEVVVNMRTRPRTGGQLEGHERITAFLNELQEVWGDLKPVQVLTTIRVASSTSSAVHSMPSCMRRTSAVKYC